MSSAEPARHGREHPEILRWTEPVGRPVGAVVVAPALAVSPGYYRPFIGWLASRGFRAGQLVYPGSVGRDTIRAYRGDLLDWFGAAVAAVDDAIDEELPHTWVGHSIGALALPFADHARLSAAVLVTAGSGWVGHMQGHRRWTVPGLMRTVGPAAIRSAGYFPGRRLRLLGDLPAGVMSQWLDWCLHHDYLGADVTDLRSRFSAVRLPLLSLSFGDDELLTPSATADALSWFSAARTVHARFSPAQLGVERMGHFGFFRQQHEALWDELLLPYLAVRDEPSGSRTTTDQRSTSEGVLQGSG